MRAGRRKPRNHTGTAAQVHRTAAARSVSSVATVATAVAAAPDETGETALENQHAQTATASRDEQLLLYHQPLIRSLFKSSTLLS